MTIEKAILLCGIVLFLDFPGSARAGTNGILEGRIRDKNTAEPVVGVNVLIVGTQRGAITDVSGRFEIQSLRAGAYEIRFSHIGYRSFVLKNVVINPDLRTRIAVELEPAEVEMEEMTVVQEKPLIQKDVTETTYSVGGEELTMLPVDNASDIVRMKAGVTPEGNIRGGKTSEVLYLIDGLPVKDVMGGELSATLPKSSIVNLSIHTGGFEPEYGNALSGLVNIVTKSGSNAHEFSVRAAKDNVFGGTQVSKTNDVEVAASGPILEDRLFYVGSLNAYLTDTRWWQDLQHFFPSPVDKTWNGFGKLDYVLSPTARLGAQVLFSQHDWRDYEFDWRFNLNGLPPEHRTAYRVAAILSHSISDDFFYTASLSRFSLDAKIGDGAKTDVPANTPYQYDLFLQYIVAGDRAWWSRTTQTTYTGKADATLKVGGQHLLKFGGEVSLYDLNSDLVKYEPRKTYFGKPLINEPQLDFSSSYSYLPRSGSAYVQDKLDIPDEGILLNFGVRYDFLNPRANRPDIEAIPVKDTAYSFSVANAVRASLKQQLSPRLGAAMQVTEQVYLFVNLGWYFQYPLFDYLYTGLDRAALAKGLSAISGNPDLEPERTQSYEISVKYNFTGDYVGSVTYFRKETTNQIDTKTFVPGDSKLAGSFGFAEYVNNPYAEAYGVELVISRERGEWLTGELSYTLMSAQGTSGSPFDGFYIAQFGLPPASRIYPLSWDQRHSVKLLASVTTPWDLAANIVVDYHSGWPYTNYPTSTGFEKIDGGAFDENNARMPDYTNVDLKVTKSFRWGWWPNSVTMLFLDVRNALNAKNVRWVDSNGRVGGELGDPSGYYPGRRTSVGLQVAF